MENESSIPSRKIRKFSGLEYCFHEITGIPWGRPFHCSTFRPGMYICPAEVETSMANSADTKHDSGLTRTTWKCAFAEINFLNTTAIADRKFIHITQATFRIYFFKNFFKFYYGSCDYLSKGKSEDNIKEGNKLRMWHLKNKFD